MLQIIAIVTLPNFPSFLRNHPSQMISMYNSEYKVPILVLPKPTLLADGPKGEKVHWEALLESRERHLTALLRMTNFPLPTPKKNDQSEPLKIALHRTTRSTRRSMMLNWYYRFSSGTLLTGDHQKSGYVDKEMRRPLILKPV